MGAGDGYSDSFNQEIKNEVESKTFILSTGDSDYFTLIDDNTTISNTKMSV